MLRSADNIFSVQIHLGHGIFNSMRSVKDNVGKLEARLHGIGICDKHTFFGARETSSPLLNGGNFVSKAKFDLKHLGKDNFTTLKPFISNQWHSESEININLS